MNVHGMTNREHGLVTRALAVTLLLLLSAGMAWAGSDQRKGTGGATELLIPVGPRGTALGGAAVSDVDGVESMYWNPAGLGGLEGTQVLLSHTSYIAGMKVNYAGAATRVGSLGVLGVSAKVLSVGDIIETTEQQPDGTGSIIDPTFTVLGMGWARQFTDRVRFGANLSLIGEHLQDNSANGFAVDFGVQYDTGWRGVKFGMVMKNFGPSMSWSGPSFDESVQSPGSDPSSSNRIVRFSSAPFELPSYFTLSATYDAYRVGHTSVRMLGSFQNNNFYGDNFTIGGEWTYRDLLMLRGSWYGTMNSTIDPVTGDETQKFSSGDDVYSGVAIGAGLSVPTGGSHLGIDLAWKPVRAYFDDTLEIGVGMKF
jgi:hypothetical protein